MTDPGTTDPVAYAVFSRAQWRARGGAAQGSSSPVGPVPADEVATIYAPLVGFVRDRMAAARAGTAARPFVLGISGSVASGKSTAARTLRVLLSESAGGAGVEHVTTDGFLFPNAVLEARGIMARKGFPESYDSGALAGFLAALRSGAEEVRAPQYSHETYDIVPGGEIVVRGADVVIVEGVNVLQPAVSGPDGESLDLALYVDAAEADLERWYEARLFGLRDEAVADPDSWFGFLVGRTDDEVSEFARRIWRTVNLVNLREHIAPTRPRAHIVLDKGGDHAIERVRVRRR
ncbi:MAG: type I pantothenate kinase [Actinomycetota bacterium]